MRLTAKIYRDKETGKKVVALDEIEAEEKFNKMKRKGRVKRENLIIEEEIPLSELFKEGLL